jgi:hypothetical protein
VIAEPPIDPCRRTLRLTTRCPNACIFCAQDGLEPDELVELDAALTRLRDDGANEVTFTGGEPSVHPDVVEAVTRARALGFGAVGLQTNAAGLTTERIDALERAGLSDVHLSLHGGSAAVHDYHTGREGSFAALVRAAEALRARELEVVVTTVLTRSNFRVLAPISEVLLRLGVSAWSIALPVTHGRAADGFDRIVPRLGLALPFALHASTSAGASGLPVAIVGAPLCALGPHARLALPSTTRAFADVCASCPCKPECPGVDAAYLERFTGEELRPRERAATALAVPARLARMFVGVGEVVHRTPSLHPAPASVRRSLPVLGRARPAEQETRRRGSARTGRALREIFPDLFEPDEG